MNNYSSTNRRQRPENNQGAPDTREKLKITVDPQIGFDGTFKTKRTTTIELAKKFNSIFRPVFNDFEGSIILPNQQNQLVLTLYFTDKGAATNGSYKAITPLMKAGRNSSIGDKLRSFNAMNKMHSYDLTDETKEMLSDFIYVRNNQKIKWDNYIIEQPDTTRYGQYNIIVGVINLDITRVLKRLYKNESEGRIDYEVKFLRPVMGRNDNFLIDIIQLDTKKVEELANQAGMAPVVSGLSIVR